MRIRLVVFKFVIEIWLVLLDERAFQNECFGFVVGDDEFDDGDLVYQLFGLDAITEFAAPAGLEIRTHPVAQILGLADIDDLSFGVLMQIHSRRARNLFKLFVESHGLFRSQHHSSL